MTTITSQQAESQFGDLLKRVANGEEIVITTDEMPVARLIPECAFGLESARQAIRSIKERRRQISQRSSSTLSYAEVKQCIEEGRR
jgi:prevent-host-death family protein